jgi:hypothetical protein
MNCCNLNPIQYDTLAEHCSVGTHNLRFYTYYEDIAISAFDLTIDCRVRLFSYMRIIRRGVEKFPTSYGVANLRYAHAFTYRQKFNVPCVCVQKNNAIYLFYEVIIITTIIIFYLFFFFYNYTDTRHYCCTETKLFTARYVLFSISQSLLCDASWFYVSNISRYARGSRRSRAAPLVFAAQINCSYTRLFFPIIMYYYPCAIQIRVKYDERSTLLDDYVDNNWIRRRKSLLFFFSFFIIIVINNGYTTATKSFWNQFLVPFIFYTNT